jgi:hypothetical protein
VRTEKNTVTHNSWNMTVVGKRQPPLCSESSKGIEKNADVQAVDGFPRRSSLLSENREPNAPASALDRQTQQMAGTAASAVGSQTKMHQFADSS